MERMSLNRRTFLRTTVIAAGATVLGACVAPQPTPTVGKLEPPPTQPAAAPKPTQAPEKPTVAVPASQGDKRQVIAWVGVQQDFQLEAAARPFLEKNPRIDFKIEKPANRAEKLSTALAAGVGLPEFVLLNDTQVPIYYEGLVDMTSYVTPYLKDLVAFKIQVITVGGKTYGVPWDVDPACLFYRRDILEKAGVDPEKIETYDDLLAAGVKIKEATGGKTRLMIFDQNIGGQMYQMEMFGHQQGVSLFDRNNRFQMKSPEFDRALRFLAMVQKSDLGIRRTWATPASYKAYIDAEVAFQPWASWWAQFYSPQLKEAAGRFGLVKLPAFTKGGGRNANMGGSAWSIPQKAKNRDDAWAVLEQSQLTRQGWQAQLRAEGAGFILPSYVPAFEDGFYDQPVAFFGGQKIWRVWVDIARNLPSTVWYPAYWREAVLLIGNHVQAMLDGQKTVEQVENDALAELKQKVKEVVI